MAIHAWKTNFVGLNKPSKVLSGTAMSFVSLGSWPYPNDITDPYWSGGYNPQPYKWEVTFSVDERAHGSNLTRIPYLFNAHDIEVGDFVSGAQDGKVLQIMSILTKTNNMIVAVCEDRLRYNTFNDPAGWGMFGTPGAVIFFQINELGYPMLDPLPGVASANFADNVQSRFQYLNPLINYLLEQEDNGFVQGNAICIDNGLFALSNANNVGKFIGTVVHPGPGPHGFILRPANGIIDFVPNLPGVIGDYVYPSIDGSGALTTSDASRRPIYMVIELANPSITTGLGIDPTGTDGDVIEFNRLQMTLQSGNGTYTIDDAVDIINANTAYHSITASKVGAATLSTSDVAINGSAYGLVGGYAPFSATINSVVVNFTTTTSGSAAYGEVDISDINDMVTDINSAGLIDLIASASGTMLTLTNTVGGSITIVNTEPDKNGNNFSGLTSISSLNEFTAANTTTFSLRLTRDDGGPLTISDVQGQFITTAGVMSGQTGHFALGLQIEQGLRSSATVVVANIMARDSLNALVGDQSYVIDDGNGEWALFTYPSSESGWVKIGGQRSVSVDARTIIDDITLPHENASIGIISENRRILNVSVIVLTELVAAPDFTVIVGDEIVWQFSKHGGSAIGIYNIETSLVTFDRRTVNINMPTYTGTGTFRVEVTYI